jgi:hypothetical protein
MRQLSQIVKDEIVSRYNAGERLVPLARAFHIRAANVSALLKEAGIDVQTESLRRSCFIRSRPNKTSANKATGLGRKPTKEEWAYIAGIFDGEGSLSVQYHTDGQRMSGYYANIAQQGRTLHEWIQSALGDDHIHKGGMGKVKQMFHFRLCAQRKVLEFLNGVMPYLIVKKEFALEVVNFIKNRYGW